MTRGGAVWFAVQMVIFVAMLAAPIIQRSEVPVAVRVVGVLLLVAGLALAGAGYRSLGGSHSPGTTPITGARLVSTGVYGYLRHPIYAGWCLGAFGVALIFGSLLGVGVAVALVVFYDLRTREEEKFLMAEYPDYGAYRQRVKGRLVPRSLG